MTDPTRLEPSRRTFLKQAAMGTAAVLAYPTARVLGANDRVRVGMIGVGDRGNDLLGQIRSVHGVEVVAMADVYSRRRDQAKIKCPASRPSTITAACSKGKISTPSSSPVRCTFTRGIFSTHWPPARIFMPRRR